MMYMCDMSHHPPLAFPSVQAVQAREHMSMCAACCLLYTLYLNRSDKLSQV